MNKLPVLKETKEEILMEVQELGITPVVKRYCSTCEHCYNKNTKSKTEYATSNRCSISHGEWCSIVNPKFDCIHWIQQKQNISKTNLGEVLIKPLLMIILPFIIGFMFSKLFL